MVAGYGFGDVPVNAAIAHGWRKRKSASRWLVVERGSVIGRFHRLMRVAKVMAWPSPRTGLLMSWSGLPRVATDEPAFWK